MKVSEAIEALKDGLTRRLIAPESPVWKKDAVLPTRQAIQRKPALTVGEMLDDLAELEPDTELVLVSDDGWEDPVIDVRAINQRIDFPASPNPARNAVLFTYDSLCGEQQP